MWETSWSLHGLGFVSETVSGHYPPQLHMSPWESLDWTNRCACVCVGGNRAPHTPYLRDHISPREASAALLKLLPCHTQSNFVSECGQGASCTDLPLDTPLKTPESPLLGP